MTNIFIMKNNRISPELKSLINEKSGLCVSMIIPLHEIPSFKKLDSIVVDHAINKLRAQMEPAYDQQIVNEFIEKVKYLKDDVRNINGVKGLGVFMSEKVFHTETFPFDVKERVHVGPSFEVRDVLYKQLFLKEYYVLSLTGHVVRLYKGQAWELTEIEDHNFPAEFIETEFAIPVLENQGDNASKTMKRHKSEIMESPKAFFNVLDKKLLDYVNEQGILVITGVEKELSAFETSTSYPERIKCKVPGNYENGSSLELGKICYDAVKGYQTKSEKKIVESLAELFGRQLVAIGIQDVWRNAKSGKGNVLVVERDLSLPGFVTDDEYHLWLSPPLDNHRIVTDTVDDVIETVIEKNGDVVFVENGTLKEYNGIAMITRY